MGTVTEFCGYKSRRDFERKLVRLGWTPTRLQSPAVEGTAIYLYDDHTRLLLFSLVQRPNLEMISRRVRYSPDTPLFTLAETLNSLIADFSLNPPFAGDSRLQLVADTVAWFTGFSLSAMNARTLGEESIAIFRLLDSARGESAFHLAHLDWPQVVARNQASARFACMARSLRQSLLR